MGLMAYASAMRLYEWYETGRLVMHKKMPTGPDTVSYADEPVRFLMEFDLYLFLIAMGAFGILAACRDMIVAMTGSQSRLSGLTGWHDASDTLSLVVRFAVVLFLLVLAFSILYRSVVQSASSAG